MKIFTKKDKRTKDQKEIERLQDQLSTMNASTKEYTTINENLIRKQELVIVRKPPIVSTELKNTLIVVGAQLVITFLVSHVEYTEVLNSKVLNFLPKRHV